MYQTIKKWLYRLGAGKVLAVYYKITFNLARMGTRVGTGLRVRAPFWRYRLAHPFKKRRQQHVFIAYSSSLKLGLFAYVSWFYMSALHAEKLGADTVVDMQNQISTYLDTASRGRENVWEAYFEQPGGLSLRQAYAARKVTFSPMMPRLDPSPYDSTRLDWLEDPALVERFQAQYRRYIRYSPEAAAHVQRVAAREFAGRQGVVGVLCRGTDYINGPSQHHRQPTPQEAMAQADRLMDKYGLEFVYLATEDSDILAAFKARYGDALIYNTDSIRHSVREDSFHTKLEKKAIDRKQAGLNYIADLDLLARCDCLVTGIVSPTPFLFMMKQGAFLEYYIYDEGCFE